MASTKDIHDIMGMGGAVQKPASKKKKKVVETQPRLSGISREVQALMGDSVPPVQIVETPKYKSKPTLASKFFKPRHWEQVPFEHGAREDGLILRHWKRAIPSIKPPQTNGDVDMSHDDQVPMPQFEPEFPMEKWDVRIKVPQYTEEQYEKHFQSDDWSRAETNYLLDLASEYSLRWIVIADRYEPQDIPSSTNGTEDGMEVTKQYPTRTMEQLKLRYYEVAAQDLELRIPKTNMTQAEFQLWEKMRNFDAKTETLRKATAEKLFERSREDAEEERTLLEELHRITKNEEDFIAMRKDLYARLEAAPSLRRNERGEEQNIVLSSAGLGDLLNRLFAKDRAFKRRVIPNGETSASAQVSHDPKGRQTSQIHRRDTLETPTAEKKGSISQPVVKQLSKADEEKFGVTHAATGERLTSGVSFRHEKINRVTTAKSQVQTQKINAALTELEIPARLSMPTEKVCKEFERLVGQIQLLLDARKTLTRVSEEIKTLEEMRRQRLGEPAPQKANEANLDGATQAASANSTAAQPNDASNAPEDTSKENDDKDDGEPGPAVHDDDEEDEGENNTSNVERTQVEDEDEDEEDDDAAVDESVANKDDADEDEDEGEDDAENEEEDEEEEEEEADDDDEEGTAALRRGAENEDDDDDDEEEEEEEEEEEHEPLVEEGDDDDEEDAEGDDDAEPTQNGADSDEDQEEDDEETQDVSAANAAVEDEEDEEEEDEEDEEEDPSSRPTSAAGHKRGASTVSDASGNESNRNGASRKRKR